MFDFKKSSRYLYLLGAVFVFALFYFISVRTPLAGDDWGYAINGMKGNPLVTTYNFYFNWSGRIFSELWGFLVAPNKWLWNILNPLFFTIIFIAVYKIIDPKEKHVLYVFLILAVILSVDDNLRMETYSWIMGTTYIIPLMLSLVYFYIIVRLIDNGVNFFRKGRLMFITNLLLFYIGLTMENIAGVMVGGILILLIYSYFNNKELVKLLVTNLVFSTISFTILRLSPGAASRLINDHAAWAEMGVLEKLSVSYPNFINLTFIKNDYAVAIFSGIVLLYLLSVILYSNKNKVIAVISVFFQLITVFALFSFVLNLNTTMFSDSSSLFNMIYWPVYIVDIIIVILVYFEDDNRLKALYFLIIAGAANLVMLYSPIFGSRSSVYFVFYLIVVTGLVLKEIKVDNKFITILMSLAFLFIVYDRTTEFIYKYNLVNSVQNERLEIYQYYRDHPEDTDVWIPRMPPLTVHASDVEPDDVYHLEVFKEYYGLPQDYQNIQFYWKEAY